MIVKVTSGDNSKPSQLLCVLYALHEVIHLILTTAVGRKYYYYLHFIGHLSHGDVK